MEKKVGFWYPRHELRYEFQKKAYAGLPSPVEDATYRGSDEQRRFVKCLSILERDVHRYVIAHLEDENYHLKRILDLGGGVNISADTPKALIHEYRGWSECRCCRQRNGSREYKFNFDGYQWVWPEGYMHYIEDHAVRPDEEFRAMVYKYCGVDE